jgi:hypothetical protein
MTKKQKIHKPVCRPGRDRRFLVQQIKTRKTLTISYEPSAQLKETNINIGLSILIYIVDIMFVYMTNAIH